MADKTLNGLRVAILATDGFEQVEGVSRKPDDITAFNQQMMELFRTARQRQHAA